MKTLRSSSGLLAASRANTVQLSVGLCRNLILLFHFDNSLNSHFLFIAPQLPPHSEIHAWLLFFPKPPRCQGATQGRESLKNLAWSKGSWLYVIVDIEPRKTRCVKDLGTAPDSWLPSPAIKGFFQRCAAVIMRLLGRARYSRGTCVHKRAGKAIWVLNGLSAALRVCLSNMRWCYESYSSGPAYKM